MQFRRMGVFGDSNEQFRTHEKVSPTSTIYVNCMKHDPLDLIYNFMLSKALLIHIYIVSIWCMTSFTIHLAFCIKRLHQVFQGALAIRRIFSLVDMIIKPKFSNCPNIFKIGLFR